MALFKKTLSVCAVLALLLALAVPAFAAPPELNLTAWRFDSFISSPPWNGSLQDYLGSYDEVSFYFGGYQNFVFVDMYWDPDNETLYYVRSDGQQYTAYNSRTGWRQDNMRTISFTAAQSDNDDLQEWLYLNAVNTWYNGISVPVLTFVIDGTPYSFSNYRAASGASQVTPTVVLAVTTDSAQLRVGGRSLVWYAPSGRVFTGLSYEDDNTPDYIPGETYDLDTADRIDASYPLYPCFEEYSSGPLYTTVQIYSNDGSILRLQYSAFSEALSPSLTVRVLPNGVELLSNGQIVDSYIIPYDENQPSFTGLSTRRNANNPVYGIDSVVTVGGQNQDTRVNFYLTFQTGISDPAEIDWTSWIITAVGGFFAFELWPGLNLGDLVLTVLALGVLFSFLKLTI